MADTIKIVQTSQLTPRDWQEVQLICKHSCHTDGHALGFLPLAAYETRHDKGDILAEYRNGDLVGYVLVGINRWRECRILQIWVRPDARQIEHGRALVQQVLRQKAEPARCWILRLWCADDLAANLFWQALGFQRRGWRWGRSLKRRHYLWTISLEHDHAPWPPRDTIQYTDGRDTTTPSHPLHLEIAANHRAQP